MPIAPSSLSSPYLQSPATPNRTAGGAANSRSPASEPVRASDPEDSLTSSAKRKSATGQALDDGQLRELRDLKARDREVRAHEAAHQSVGGQQAGSASFTYSRGPDGVQYATGGEVPVNMGAVPDHPRATLEKMRVVRAAALAPAQPSAQDRQVAAQAMQQMLQAQVELAAQQSEAVTGGSDGRASDREKSEADATYRNVAALEPAKAEPFRASDSAGGALRATA